MKVKILEAIKTILAATITAMNEGKPFMLSGVIGNGADPVPFGVTCGNGVQLEELKPFFEANNDNMFSAQDRAVETIVSKAAEPKGIEARIEKQGDGTVKINFNQPNISAG